MSDLRGSCRPDWIPTEVFRAWLGSAQLASLMRIDDMLPASYVSREQREGRPIRAMLAPTATGPFKTANRWRPLDLVARARAHGHRVSPAGVLGSNGRRSAVARLVEEREHLESEVARLREEASALRKAVSEGQPLLEFFEAAPHLRRDRIFSSTEIVDAARPITTCSGVYFLISSGRISYVGQSTNVLSRIGSHAGVKQFDAVAVIPCDISELDVLESMYIHILKPPGNGRASSDVMCAPMSPAEVLEVMKRGVDTSKGSVTERRVAGKKHFTAIRRGFPAMTPNTQRTEQR